VREVDLPALWQAAHGPARPGRVVRPAFAADEIGDALRAVLDTYLDTRQPGERFIDTLQRVGLAPFRAATDAVRRSTAIESEEA